MEKDILSRRVDKHFVHEVVDTVLDGIVNQINYNFVCQMDDSCSVDYDKISIGIHILLRTTIRSVEIMQCAPFFLTVSEKHNQPRNDSIYFGISQMASPPMLIHVSNIESKKKSLDLLIDALEKRNWDLKMTQNGNEVILSNDYLSN